MTFGDAIEHLKLGGKVSRKGWNGPGQYLELCEPAHQSAMDLPFIFIMTVQKQAVPWLASQTDMLANDWAVV